MLNTKFGRRVGTVLFLVLMGFSAPTVARTLQEVDFAESIKLGEQELKLNGLGLRKVQKFGIPIKVYVAGL
ncbi:MAG: chalcone isomerase family protein, partial [Bdellovibrionales bacterium]|nr:chalcone isomerase family protein [Bdellovibrionales bacterium]